MKRESLLMFTGFSLLVIVFIAAATNIWKRSASEADPNKAIIRLAHWQLEPPVRAAFEKIARIYMDEHPEVSIEIIPVPERTYAQWFMTRLVGGFAPDLIEMRTQDAALISRYFTPLTEWIEKPNPYNADTAFAETSWRNTFIDGLDNDNAYHPQLLDYYAVPVSQFTNRMIYNRTLWREVLGDTPIPQTYEELRALCEKFAAEAKKSGRTDVVPFLSSFYHANGVYSRLFTSQTQKLTEQLRGTPLYVYTTPELGVDYLRGEWTMQTPEIVSGIEIMRDVSGLFQPGYEQISREDGGFRFLQGGALMLFTGSWDYGSFRDQAQFQLGVFNLPIPEPGSPGFGSFVAGQPSEGAVTTSAAFSLARQSKYPQHALDFLQFLTSERGNRIFAEASGWLPAIAGVEPEEEINAFYPQIKGVRNGFDLGTLGQQNAGRVISNGRHTLLGPKGSAEAYLSYLDKNLGDAVREDLVRTRIQQAKVVQRQDSVVAAYMTMSKLPESAGRALIKLRENEESQTLMESLNAWITLNLDEPAKQ